MRATASSMPAVFGRTTRAMVLGVSSVAGIEISAVGR
jgi:hypothetical protein